MSGLTAQAVLLKPPHTSNQPREGHHAKQQRIPIPRHPTIDESASNPRHTFDESKLHELAESIKQHGIIQPITVRPNASGFRLSPAHGASALRSWQACFRSPAGIVEIDDAQFLNGT